MLLDRFCSHNCRFTGQRITSHAGESLDRRIKCNTSVFINLVTFIIMEQRCIYIYIYIWQNFRLSDLSYCWTFQVFWDVTPCLLVKCYFFSRDHLAFISGSHSPRTLSMLCQNTGSENTATL